jgi:hypothetical protein
VATTNKYLKGDLPIAISTNIPTALVRYQRNDFAANYAIGNTPWLSGASDQNKISRITTTYQKERIDQGDAAGEQSLSNWWLRSATSWHHGAGERYYDATTSDLFRFYESNNIDTWTLGEIKLLPDVTKFASVTASNPVTVNNGTFYIENGSLKYYNGTTATTIALTGGAVPQKLTTDGTYCIVGASDGIYDVTTAGVVRKLWDKPTHNGATWSVQAIAYVKERLLIGALEGTAKVTVYEGSRVYITPTPKFDANHERWGTADLTTVINSISELNSAVIVGYTQGSVSRIQAYTLNATSALATLNDPKIIAELPRGESLNQVRVYLNEFVVLATTKGLRVGTQSTDGEGFTYGPLNVTGAVSDIAFDGSYVYACRSSLISGTAGLWRIDLGTEVGNAYAYNSDLVTDGVAPTGVAFVGSTGLKFITSTSGVFIEHPTNKAASGYLKSGWVRFGTSEKKQPVSLAIKSQSTTGGTLGFTLVDQGTQSVDIGAITLGMGTEIGVAASTQPSDHFEITFNFTRNSTDATKGPILEEWQIRGLPAPKRSRTITIPLLCYEEERDPNGQTVFSSPWERIFYLERIEQNGGAVLFQDFSSEEERICVIRAIQFEQTAPPSFARGFGGIVTLQLQTIDEEQVIT